VRDVTAWSRNPFGFNAAIARLYAFKCACSKIQGPSTSARRQARLTACPKLMAPILTPHLAEDVWFDAGGEGADSCTPQAQAGTRPCLVDAEVTHPISNQRQAVNRKSPCRRLRICGRNSRKIGLAQDALAAKPGMGAKRRKKIIVVPGRISLKTLLYKARPLAPRSLLCLAGGWGLRVSRRRWLRARYA